MKVQIIEVTDATVAGALGKLSAQVQSILDGYAQQAIRATIISYFILAVNGSGYSASVIIQVELK